VDPPSGAPTWGAAFVAGCLGRGEAVEDLPEAGPVETRETVRAFNLVRTRLDRYVRDRTAMLAAISHDLRTPITSLRLYAEFVEDAETKAKILASLDEMHRMTEDALAFIREDARREETRTVDLHALVNSVAADLADLGHDIAVDDLGRMLAACRPAALRRALRNLLENAAVHGGRATVRIERDDGEVRVVVEDEGPGIPEAELVRVFEPFVRLEVSRSSRDTGGSGLGLAIARGIVCAATAAIFAWRTAPKAGCARRSRACRVPARTAACGRRMTAAGPVPARGPASRDRRYSSGVGTR